MPKTIVVDEPNSFLHPAASRKLLDIVQRYGHQYIISTHAPEVISNINADKLYLVRWDGCRSKLDALDSRNVSEIKRALSEVGVRLSDLFSADAILWVEGQTEEKCFPLLVTAAGLRMPSGLAIVPVLHTGDFESKRNRSRMAFEIYARLGTANALVPPSVAFVFDRKGRSEKEIEDLKKLGNGRVRVLNRTMYENYLVDCEAIAKIINKEVGDQLVTAQMVTSWIQLNGGSEKYCSKTWTGTVFDTSWIETVHAAKLLEDMFSELTDARLEYRKTTHSVAITAWIIANKAASLKELYDCLLDIFRTSLS